MKDLNKIGEDARLKAISAAVMEAYEVAKSKPEWEVMNKTNKLMSIAVELNTTHTTVNRFLVMNGINL